jgi:hypothetical protein
MGSGLNPSTQCLQIASMADWTLSDHGRPDQSECRPISATTWSTLGAQLASLSMATSSTISLQSSTLDRQSRTNLAVVTSSAAAKPADEAASVTQAMAKAL